MAIAINWNNIDTVFLDMDGTLLDLHFDNFFWLEHLPLRYAQHHNVNRDEARQYLYDRFSSERGTINWYCLDYWGEELQIDIVQLKSELSHLIAIHPDVISFLNALTHSNKKSVLVTNAHQKSLELKLKQTNLGRHLDTIICAHDLGLPKEQPVFWQRLQQIIEFNPERTLLIDDNLDVLRSAHQGGITHLLAISRPDSNRAIQSTAEFNALDHFRDIIPTP